MSAICGGRDSLGDESHAKIKRNLEFMGMNNHRKYNKFVRSCW